MLFTTGYARSAIVHRPARSGVELIVKPFTTPHLPLSLKTILEGK